MEAKNTKTISKKLEELRAKKEMTN